jgi:hypothetical protein
MKRDTIGSHCNAHIMHNCVQVAVVGFEQKLMDVLLVKIHKYYTAFLG